MENSAHYQYFVMSNCYHCVQFFGSIHLVSTFLKTQKCPPIHCVFVYCRIRVSFQQEPAASGGRRSYDNNHCDSANNIYYPMHSDEKKTTNLQKDVPR